MTDALDGRLYTAQALARDLWDETKDKDRIEGIARLTYGYAITAHKAQGSQWDHVVIVDESSVFSRDEDGRRIPEDMLRRRMRGEMTIPSRWRYTAATRAVKSVRIVNRLPW